MAARRQICTEVLPRGGAAVSAAKGTVYMFGMGDIGQLGIDATKRKYPTQVPDLPSGGKEVVQVECGGIHTEVLLKDGTVWTYGNNDDGALGRLTPDEDDMKRPGKVELDEFVIQVTAGDMHSAALTRDGLVYVWGNFRDSNGKMSLFPEKSKDSVPKPKIRLLRRKHAVDVALFSKIASGSNHLVMLDRKGLVYRFGSGQQGQLGRPTEDDATYKEFSLKPRRIRALDGKRVEDIWAGDFSSYFKTSSGSIYACGLNNYGQLGLEVNPGHLPVLVPTKSV